MRQYKGSTPRKGVTRRAEDKRMRIDRADHLVSSGGETQAKLSAHHHGLVDAPVLAADRAPALHSSDLYQHLHATLGFVSTSSKPHLKAKSGFCIIEHRHRLACGPQGRVCVCLTMLCVPVLGTLQRTATSCLCLMVYRGTPLDGHSIRDVSLPVHWTLFMWMGPEPRMAKLREWSAVEIF